MLFAADTPAAPAPPVAPLAPSSSFTSRVKGYVTTYAPKAERIIDAPVYDTAAVLGVDVIWLGGVILALKIISTGVWWEFFRKPACPTSCPVRVPTP